MNVDSSSLNKYTPDEMMTIAAARLIWPSCVCFVGIGVPSAAVNLARLTHAPDIVLIYESGAIGTQPRVLPLSIGDGELAAGRGGLRRGEAYAPRPTRAAEPEQFPARTHIP